MIDSSIRLFSTKLMMMNMGFSQPPYRSIFNYLSVINRLLMTVKLKSSRGGLLPRKWQLNGNLVANGALTELSHTKPHRNRLPGKCFSCRTQISQKFSLEERGRTGTLMDLPPPSAIHNHPLFSQKPQKWIFDGRSAGEQIKSAGKSLLHTLWR